MQDLSRASRPRAINNAVTLLWASLAIGLAKMLMDSSRIEGTSPATFTNSVLVLTFAFIIFLIFKISEGKNWARILFLIVYLAGSIPAAPLIFDEFTSSPVLGALSMAQVGIQGYALVLMFASPGRKWFQQTPSQ